MRIIGVIMVRFVALLLVIWVFAHKSDAECYEVPYQSIGKIGAYHNVCNPVLLSRNLEWQAVNITGGDVWFLLPPVSTNTLISLEGTIFPAVSAFYNMYLYDQLGSPFNIVGQVNYPLFSEGTISWNKFIIGSKCINASQSPYFARLVAYKDNNDTLPIKNSSLLLRTGTSDSFITSFVTSKTIPSNSIAYFSWELNTSSYDTYTTTRFTEIISSQNISATIFSSSCQLLGGYLPTTCIYTPFYPHYLLPSSSIKKNDGNFLTVGFPSTNQMTKDDLILIGIDNNSTTDINVSVKTYQVTTTSVPLDSIQKGIVCIPGKYTVFQIPYNPFNGQKLPPLIKIKITVLPEGDCRGSPFLRLFYCENNNLAGCNEIDAIQSDSQNGGCDPLQIDITSQGPWEYFSLYNEKSDPITVTITTSDGKINSPGIPLWVWVAVATGGAAVLVVVLVTSVCCCLCKKKTEYQHIN